MPVRLFDHVLFALVTVQSKYRQTGLKYIKGLYWTFVSKPFKTLLVKYQHHPNDTTLFISAKNTEAVSRKTTLEYLTNIILVHIVINKMLGNHCPFGLLQLLDYGCVKWEAIAFTRHRIMTKKVNPCLFQRQCYCFNPSWQQLSEVICILRVSGHKMCLINATSYGVAQWLRCSQGGESLKIPFRNPPLAHSF